MRKLILGLVLLLMILLRTLSFAEEKGVVAGITIEQGIEIAKKEVSGKVIEAEDEKGIYEIKIMTEGGEMVKFKIDPSDGKIIRKGKIIKGLSSGSGKSGKETDKVQR